MIHLKAFVLFLAVSFVAPERQSKDAESSGKIRVVITGFETDEGNAKIALTNSAETFLSRNVVKGVSKAIVGGRSELDFEALPFGTYAIAVYHDENDNGEMDKNFLGIPTEDYGFSNNARGTFGPPGFDQAKFQLESSEITVEIEVK